MIITTQVRFGGILFTEINQEIGRCYPRTGNCYVCFFFFHLEHYLFIDHGIIVSYLFIYIFDLAAWICIYLEILIKKDQLWYLLVAELGLSGKWFEVDGILLAHPEEFPQIEMNFWIGFIQFLEHSSSYALKFILQCITLWLLLLLFLYTV